MPPPQTRGEAGIGGWAKATGNGTWGREGNKLGGTSSDANTTIAVDNNAPSQANGFYSFLVSPVSGQKFGAVIRYVSGTNYSAITYDNGAFSWQNGSGQSGALFTVTPFALNSTHRIDIDYSSTSTRVKVDGFVKYDGTISQVTTGPGKVGLMEWGSAHSQFDCVAQSSTVAARKVTQVYLKDAPVTWTYLSNLTMRTGDSKQLYAEVYPYDATNTNITWASTNTSVITVNSSGLITAVAPGTAYISIDSADGAYTRKVMVTVNK